MKKNVMAQNAHESAESPQRIAAEGCARGIDSYMVHWFVAFVRMTAYHMQGLGREEIRRLQRYTAVVKIGQ